MSLIQKKFVVGPFQCNCRLLACPNTGKAVLVDPGAEPEKLISELEKIRLPNGEKVRVEYLLHTHAHLDHIGATRDLVENARKTSTPTTGVPKIALHRDDHEIYLALREQGGLFGLKYEDPLPVDHFLGDEEALKVGDFHLSVIHTPGHSPGSVCFRLHEDSGLGIQETLFSGDTLFQGSVGRTDLWGANQDVMFRSIRDRILVLDDETRLCPGHGPDSSVGIEKRTNPFLT